MFVIKITLCTTIQSLFAHIVRVVAVVTMVAMVARGKTVLRQKVLPLRVIVHCHASGDVAIGHKQLATNLLLVLYHK